jgi:hypothetical protein
MDISTYRDARILMIKDSILAMSARLGEYSTTEINEIPAQETIEDWTVGIRAHQGVGERILRLLEITFENRREGLAYKINLDVVGKKQCRNMQFDEINPRTVNDQIFNDLLLLPEMLGDFLATELHHRFGKE